MRYLIGALLFTVATAFAAAADQEMINSPGGVQIGTETSWVNARLFSFRTAGVEDCSITTDLKVRGPRRQQCVEHLETAARLARAEMRVNERRRR